MIYYIIRSLVEQGYLHKLLCSSMEISSIHGWQAPFVVKTSKEMCMKAYYGNSCYACESLIRGG